MPRLSLLSLNAYNWGAIICKNKEKTNSMLNFFKKYSKWATIFVVGAALIAVYKTFSSFGFLANVWNTVMYALQPFIVAFVIAYLLNIPVMRFKALIEKKINIRFVKKHAMAFSIAVVYILSILMLVIVLWAILPALFKNLIDMATNMPKYIEGAVDYINNSPIMEKFGIEIDSRDMDVFFRNILQEVNSGGMSNYAQGIFSITSGIISFASEAMRVFVGIIASIYMLIDKDRIIRGLKRLVKLLSKNGKVSNAFDRLANINTIFTQYIYSRLICCIIMAIVCSIILAIMGEKYALLLGIFIGIMDIIPYFGSIISWIVSGVIMLISGGPAHAAWCSALMLVMQQIDGNVIAPRVMGSRLEIRPLTIIAAVSIGGTLFGFIGMIISVPVVAVGKLIFSDYLQSREKDVRREKFEAAPDEDSEENETTDTEDLK